MESFTTSDAKGKTTDPNALAAAQALRVVRDGGKWHYSQNAYISRTGALWDDDEPKYLACAVGMMILARKPRIISRTLANFGMAELYHDYAYKVWPELVGYQFYESDIDFDFTAPMGFFEALDYWNRVGWDLSAIINIIEMSQYKVVTT